MNFHHLHLAPVLSYHLFVYAECLTQEAHLGHAWALWLKTHPNALCLVQTWHNVVQMKVPENEEMKSPPHTPAVREAIVACRMGSLSGICWNQDDGWKPFYLTNFGHLTLIQNKRKRYPLWHVVKFRFQPFVFPLLSIIQTLIFID